MQLGEMCFAFLMVLLGGGGTGSFGLFRVWFVAHFGVNIIVSSRRAVLCCERDEEMNLFLLTGQARTSQLCDMMVDNLDARWDIMRYERIEQ